jgi:hypothetical protein
MKAAALLSSGCCAHDRVRQVQREFPEHRRRQISKGYLTCPPHYFFAARIFAHLAFCAAAMRLRADADILRRGLAPLFPETFPAVFAALIFAQRARAAALILLLPAADILRVRVVSPAGFCTTTSSPNSVRTCCNRTISPRTS